MKSKTPLSQERVMAIIKAGESLLTAYEALTRVVHLFRQQGEQFVSVDLLLETIAQHQPSLSAVQLLAAEKAHFEARWKINERARVGMRTYREARDLELGTELGLNLTTPSVTETVRPYIDLENGSRLEFAPSASSEPIVSKELDLDQIPLSDYHNLLRETFGAIVVFKKEIHDALVARYGSAWTDQQSLTLIERLLDTTPPGAPLQFLSQAGPEMLGRVRINDI